MFSVRSMSPSFSFSLSVMAIASALAGCNAGPNDNVYSPDEERSDVAPIARGEASFPISVGSNVPDANGDAVPLQASMVGVRVRFADIMVSGTCDSDAHGDGEFYFDMGINGRSIAKRDREHYYSAGEGDTIVIDGDRIFFVQPDESFNVHMRVDEADDFLNGADDHVGSRALTHTARDLRAGSYWQTVDLGGGDCAVSVTYSLERVQ